MTATETKTRAMPYTIDMVQSIISGKKRQTRRPIDWQKIAKKTGCTKGRLAYSTLLDNWAVFDGNGGADQCEVDCPYGRVGDRLWVREPGVVEVWLPAARIIKVQYLADREIWKGSYPPRLKWEPVCGHGIPNGIFREAARLTLEITRVRVERVQDITEEDAMAEGCRGVAFGDGPDGADGVLPSEQFAALWGSIYGNWPANPWVWVIEFELLSNS